MTPPFPIMCRVQAVADTDLAPTPVLADNDGDHDRFAHIVRSGDAMAGYVMGARIRALCGWTGVPHRDASRYPVCPTCKEVFRSLFGDRPLPQL